MLDTQNQGPQCTACGSPMRLTAIEPSTLGQDLNSEDAKEGIQSFVERRAAVFRGR